MHRRFSIPGGLGALISMIPPISTTILGMLIGRLLMNKQTRPTYKIRILALTSTGILTVGYMFSFFVPVVMKMWTVSYGLISAGWACSVLLLFYWVIDVKGSKKWAFPFVVIGMNALAIYLSFTVMRLSEISNVFTHGIVESLGQFGLIFAALVFVVLEWAILYWMYKRKIFLNP